MTGCHRDGETARFLSARPRGESPHQRGKRRGGSCRSSFALTLSSAQLLTPILALHEDIIEDTSNTLLNILRTGFFRRSASLLIFRETASDCRAATLAQHSLARLDKLPLRHPPERKRTTILK